MASPSWEQHIADDLAALRQSHLYRQRQLTIPIDATHVERDGRRLINFASNDYLGLSHHPSVITAAQAAAARDGAGSGAAPLISGYGPAHQSAERAICDWKGCEAAILFPSGYQANHAAIQTAAHIGKLQGGVRFLVDKLAHASLIDAIRATGEDFRVFPHNHMDKLRRLLAEHPPAQLQVVVTESIFSMDGDAADLRALDQLKREHEFLLILDEAHASGIYGATGEGLAAEMGVADAVDMSVLTFSKALGCIGAAVCASELFCDTLVNHARAYVFSTSIPPIVAAAADAAIAVLRNDPSRRQRLRDIAQSVRASISEMGLSIPAGDSPIIPIILGDESAALNAARQMREQGLLIGAVRPPTVARGSSRLRITLSSEHTDAEIEQFLAALTEMRSAR
jgi:8-amino-7-oxononanoate synthase